MNIFVNDDPREVVPDTTVADLLAQSGANARYVAVEVNLDLVPRARHAEHVLREGDKLEIVTLVGGG